MALQELLNLSETKKIGLSEERINAIIPIARQYISFWRDYPDLFVDFLCTGGDSTRKRNFELLFYQRIFLRAAMRKKYVYMTFPRGYSKSFLTILLTMIRSVLYPNAKFFITAGGKEQSASILKEKVDEICKKIPAFKREIDWRRGKTKEGKDKCEYVFKSGARFDNLAAKESSRGQRYTAGILEECVGIDGGILQQVIIPTMAIDRTLGDATTREDEVVNKSQVYITTAGYKNTFPYNKLIQTLVQMVTHPDKAIIMGGTWRIPVLMGLHSKSFIEDQKEDGSFNDAAFSREYESRWSGTAENAFFNGEAFDNNRTMQQPEYEYSGRSTDRSYYILAVDVGRKGCTTEICVLKVRPQANGTSIKSLVNIYSIPDTHFSLQAIFLKKLYYKYKAKIIVIDGNGLGIGLIDDMVISQEDRETGMHLPDFGIANDDEGFYKGFRTDETEDNAIYIIKATAAINTECHSNLSNQIANGKIKFLIDERVAKVKLLGTKKGQAMKPEEREAYLSPFLNTSMLKEQLMNLKEESEGINIRLKQVNSRIKKDKVSALEYGLYYIKQEEDGRQKRKKFRLSDYMFFNG